MTDPTTGEGLAARRRARDQEHGAPRVLTADELALEAGVDPQLVEQLTAIGVLKPDARHRYWPGDTIRVEAARSFLDAGISLEALHAALERGLFTFDHLHRFHPEPARPGRRLAEMSRSLGLDHEVLAAIYLAMGLPEPSPHQVLREDEEGLLREFIDLWGRADTEALVRAARLVGEPARLLADGWTRLYVEKISQPLAGEQLEMSEQVDRIVETAEKTALLAPRMLDWLLQRHLRRAIDRANMESLEESMAEHGLALPAPPRLPAIAFVDLSGYTSLTERHGDALALRVAETIREQAQRVVLHHGGSLVKLLGDGAMLHFEETTGAVRAVLHVVESLAGNGLPAHAGVHAGGVIEHDGDFYGRTVNLAARIAGRATAGEVLVSEAVVTAVREDPSLSFTRLDPVALKGVGEPVVLYRVANA